MGGQTDALLQYMRASRGSPRSMRVQAGAQMAGIEAGQISEDRHAVEAANCRHAVDAANSRHAVHGSLSPCV